MSELEQTARLEARSRELYEQLRTQQHRSADRLFAFLMVIQLVGAVLVAIVISPRTWSGSHSSVHLHVWAALLLGATLAAPVIIAALAWPGAVVTRWVIATAQMLFSALLIHLFGGRIEAHFHVFGSLAFLTFYRDWRVLIPATLVVAVDHLLRGFWWPESVFGEPTASPWRTLEHVGWVVFENCFLIRLCIAASQEMRSVARERARLEVLNSAIEAQVQERTLELSQKTADLEQQIAERRRAEAERETLHKQLVDASWHAGMAEVATGVLHNVGNVLNSVNVSTNVLADTVRRSQMRSLADVARLIQGREADLGAFLSDDPKGRLIPRYLASLAERLSEEQRVLANELNALAKSLEHMKAVVATQQSFARGGGSVAAPVVPAELVEEALRLNLMSLERHHIQIVRRFETVPTVSLDRQRVLQILVNLISNAKQALAEARPARKELTLRIRGGPDVRRFCIEVCDNGIGIPRENLTRIFAYGFTTRPDGHGFGLHSAALVAKAMGGALSAHSDGPGRGARFVLDLPVTSEVAA